MTKDLTLLFFAILTFAFINSYNAEPIAEPVVEEIGTETRDSKGTFLSSQSVIFFSNLTVSKDLSKNWVLDLTDLSPTSVFYTKARGEGRFHLP